MGFYDDMQAVASNVLRQFGQGTVKLVKETAGNGPPENPGAPTETKYPIPGAVVRGVMLKFVTLGLGETSDLQVTASVIEQRASLSDRIEIDGVSYRIRNIVSIPAAGTPVVFTYIVYKGA